LSAGRLSIVGRGGDAIDERADERGNDGPVWRAPTPPRGWGRTLMMRGLEFGLVLIAAVAILGAGIACGLPCFWRREEEAWR
jgi:hypothetical protein